MSTISKVQWTVGILLVVGLILITNYIDRRHFEHINDRMEAVYDDRLIALNIVFKMAAVMHQKQLLLEGLDQDSAGRRTVLNERLNTLIDEFSATELTPHEAATFSQFKKELDGLRTLKVEPDDQAGGKTAVGASMELINKHLAELSEVQLREGRREIQETEKAISSANLFSRIEIGTLIFLAILVQIIVLYSPKTREDTQV